ncbi:PREDICTED: uncharacterized protein LOC107070515 isoform X3 [Polistes dominula]|uniref:Uncharacterized protein LOC107070515 isoform X3 n=1 Tax=Polistes dominula TaxID=743375 RepID=A0ABM1IVN8_POLDO|nr:PREDICTED: uncharacterized protein LOC107070515 isoform X3 [Polistes dominula]
MLVASGLQPTQSCNSSNTYSFRTDKECSLNLTVLDFLYNFTEPDLEITWPCEARYYWLSLQPFVKFVRFLLSYVTPFIIIVGVILNTVSFTILNAPVSGDSSLSLYLKALAISDNGALIFNYAVGIAKSQFTFVNDLFMNSKFLCDTSSVTMELFQFTSTWLVVSLTWARVSAIIFPFEAHSSNPDRSAIISVTTLTCVSFIISLTKLYSGVETLELYWDVILIKYPENNIKENKQYINWLEEKMLLKWCRGLFFHLYHWNFACNFFLYYLTGEKFRSVVIQKLIDCKIILTSTKLTKYLPWCKCEDRFKSIRTPSILLIKVVTFDESFVNNNITTQNSSNVASII